MSQKFHEYKRDAPRDDRLRSIPIIGPIIQVGKAIWEALKVYSDFNIKC